MNTKNINIFCMNCGRRLTDEAQFCPSCGAEVVRSEQPKQQEQPEQTDRYATQYAEDPAPYEQFEPYDTPRYAPPPSEPAARGQEVPKSLYAIVLSLTLADCRRRYRRNDNTFHEVGRGKGAYGSAGRKRGVGSNSADHTDYTARADHHCCRAEAGSADREADKGGDG